jgi:hypothetical protein
VISWILVEVSVETVIVSASTSRRAPMNLDQYVAVAVSSRSPNGKSGFRAPIRA